MSEFMDRARAEAERRWPGCALHQDCEHQMRDEFQKRDRFLAGAQWSVEQEPTDAEIEVVARALFEDEVGPGNIAYYWGDQPDVRQYWLDSARAVLLAAQKVRAGQ